MKKSPLQLFPNKLDPALCHVAVVKQQIGLRQCTRKASQQRVFADGKSHPCCGLHANQVDNLIELTQQRREEKKIIEEIDKRTRKLKLQTAQAHTSIGGSPTGLVVVSLEELEARLEGRPYDGQKDSITRGGSD